MEQLQPFHQQPSAIIPLPVANWTHKALNADCLCSARNYLARADGFAAAVAPHTPRATFVASLAMAANLQAQLILQPNSRDQLVHPCNEMDLLRSSILSATAATQGSPTQEWGGGGGGDGCRVFTKPTQALRVVRG